MSLGKLDLGEPFEQLFPDELDCNNIDILNITVKHLTKLTTLPFHHKDPFDRLIIAQGLVEDLPIISIDRAFDAYEIIREW